MSAMRADAMPGGAAEVDPLEVHIAPMRRRHLRTVMRIEGQAVHHGWSVGLYLAELRRELDRRYVVARVGSNLNATVVGYGGLLLQQEDAHVTTIGVDEAWHDRRIGTRIMLVLARDAARRGAQNLTLEVRATNEPAIRLYRRFGLAPAGMRKNYYADIGEDALIMWAHEIDTPAYAERLRTIEAGLAGATILEGLDP